MNAQMCLSCNVCHRGSYDTKRRKCRSRKVTTVFQSMCLTTPFLANAVLWILRLLAFGGLFTNLVVMYHIWCWHYSGDWIVVPITWLDMNVSSCTTKQIMTACVPCAVYVRLSSASKIKHCIVSGNCEFVIYNIIGIQAARYTTSC